MGEKGATGEKGDPGGGFVGETIAKVSCGFATSLEGKGGCRWVAIPLAVTTSTGRGSTAAGTSSFRFCTPGVWRVDYTVIFATEESVDLCPAECPKAAVGAFPLDSTSSALMGSGAGAYVPPGQVVHTACSFTYQVKESGAEFRFLLKTSDPTTGIRIQPGPDDDSDICGITVYPFSVCLTFIGATLSNECLAE